MPLAQQRFPEAFPEEDEPQRCEAIEITTGFRCVSEVGHTGRHRYRDVMGDFMADATRDPTPINFPSRMATVLSDSTSAFGRRSSKEPRRTRSDGSAAG
jgi:hypothetical protein